MISIRDYSGPSFSSPPDGEAAIWEYGYVPSIAMGIVGVVTYLAISGPHLYWFVTKLGTRSVNGLLFFSALIEALGYGARLYSHNHQFSGMAFLLGISLIQIGTVLMTAAMYKALQRGCKYTPDGRRLSPMRPRSLLALFTVLDVVWVLMQIAGQYLYASAEADTFTNTSPMFAVGTSTLIFLAGNVLQAITIIIVSVFAFVMLRRYNRILTVADPNLQYPELKPLIFQVLATFGLFLIRLIVRIAQGGQGAYGYAATHEWVFAVFEYIPLFVILVIWAARPLWKFLFPLGHRHGEGAHTRDLAVEEGAVSTSQTTASPETDVKAEHKV